MEVWLGETSGVPCHDCGGPGREVMADGACMENRSCTTCWCAYVEQHRANRSQFDALIASGVDRRMANRIMCVRLGLSTEGL